MNVILISGHALSGKDTVGKWIAEALGGTTLAFADKLKAICGAMFGLSREDMYTDEGKRRETLFVRTAACSCGCLYRGEDGQGVLRCVACYRALSPRYWTVREILQHIGTEGFRAVDPEVWVKFALREAQACLRYEGPPSLADPPSKVVVITDGRFKSEIAAVKQAGGEVWRIRRPSADGKVGIAQHQSETEQDEIPDGEFDAVIENDGTLEVFRERVLLAVEGWRARRASDGSPH